MYNATVLWLNFFQIDIEYFTHRHHASEWNLLHGLLHRHASNLRSWLMFQLPTSVTNQSIDTVSEKLDCSASNDAKSQEEVVTWHFGNQTSERPLLMQYLILEEKLSISSISLHFILILTPFVDLLKHEAFNVCNVIVMFFILFFLLLLSVSQTPFIIKLFLDKYCNFRCVGYLYLSRYSSAVHPARHIDCVPPDVVLRSPCPNHPCNHWTHINTCANMRKC